MNTIGAAIQHTLTHLRQNSTVKTAVDGIYEGVAPEGATGPLILIQVYGDPEIRSYNGPTVALGAVQVSVRVVGEGSSVGALIPVAEQIAATLNGTTGTYPAGTVISCVRVREQYTSEVTAGKTVRYIGHLFNIVVS